MTVLLNPHHRPKRLSSRRPGGGTHVETEDREPVPARYRTSINRGECGKHAGLIPQGLANRSVPLPESRLPIIEKHQLRPEKKGSCVIN